MVVRGSHDSRLPGRLLTPIAPRPVGVVVVRGSHDSRLPGRLLTPMALMPVIGLSWLV